MTPMIDIVFLLIIFFMTVSQLSNQPTTSMALPVLTTIDRLNPAAELLLNVDRSGQLEVNGKIFAADDYWRFFESQPRPQDNLSEVTQEGPLRVRLRCDADCSTTHINSLFNQLSRHGYPQVTVAVREQQGN